MATPLFLILFMCVTLSQQSTTTVSGNFGDQIIRSDFKFGADIMEVTNHRPDNAPPNFRATTNLHIFSSSLVVARNSQEKHCYLRRFVESEDRMIGRIENAEGNNNHIAIVYEERVDVAAMPTLSPDVARFFLGEKIVDYCRDHDIYVVTRDHYQRLTPEDLSRNGLQKRAASYIVYATHCNCPPEQLA